MLKIRFLNCLFKKKKKKKKKKGHFKCFKNKIEFLTTLKSIFKIILGKEKTKNKKKKKKTILWLCKLSLFV